MRGGKGKRHKYTWSQESNSRKEPGYEKRSFLDVGERSFLLPGAGQGFNHLKKRSFN